MNDYKYWIFTFLLFVIMIDTPNSDVRAGGGGEPVIWMTQNTEADDVLKYGNHPKYQAVKSWVSESRENKIWYEENKEKLFWDPNSITLTWYILAPQPLQGYHSYIGWLEKLKNSGYPNYPDLDAILNFLPWDWENAVYFFDKVLWIPLSLGHVNKKGEVVFQWESVCVWSKTNSPENGKANFLNLTPDYCYTDTEDINRSHTVIGCK